MLKENGQFFHIDFAYILGMDPKPWPSPMRLNQFIISGMGSLDSQQFSLFCRYIYSAFLELQKSSQLLINAFEVFADGMWGSSLPMEKFEAIAKLETALALGKDQDESVRFINNVVKSSISAVMPEIMEKFHQFFQMLTS